MEGGGWRVEDGGRRMECAWMMDKVYDGDYKRERQWRAGEGWRREYVWLHDGVCRFSFMSGCPLRKRMRIGWKEEDQCEHDERMCWGVDVV